MINHSLSATSTTFVPSGLNFRMLCADDAEAYMIIRTEALTGKDRRYFTTDPNKELARSIEEWREVCTSTRNHSTAGAFIEEELVGVMSAKLYDGDSTGRTAYYGAAYVLPEHRHTNIIKIIFQILDNWALDLGCDRTVYTIREDNTWLEMQINHGAKIRKKMNMLFADGATAPIYLLERSLSIANPYLPAQKEFVVHAGGKK